MWPPRQEFGPRGATETPVCRLDVAVLYVEYSLAQTFHQVTVNGNSRKKLHARLPMGIVSPVGAAAIA